MKNTDIEILKNSDIFRGLTAEEIENISGRYGLSPVKYAKHEFIFTPTDYSDALAVILKGSADVYKQTAKGPLFLSILSKGDIFGMAILFSENKGFINTICAREDCRVLFISKDRLTEIFTLYPICVTNYLTVLSEKIHYLNSKISYLTEPSPTGRLLSWLVAESERQQKNEFTMPVDCSELALLLSLGRTSLYRAFNELEEQGKLSKNGKTIILHKI